MFVEVLMQDVTYASLAVSNAACLVPQCPLVSALLGKRWFCFTG